MMMMMMVGLSTAAGRGLAMNVGQEWGCDEEESGREREEKEGVED
jgi:hypothetical protein